MEKKRDDWHQFQLIKYKDNQKKLNEIISSFENISCKFCGEKKKENLIYRKNYLGFYYYIKKCRNCENTSDRRKEHNRQNVLKYKSNPKIKEIYKLRSRISNLKKLGADISTLSPENIKNIYSSQAFCPISLKKIDILEKINFVFDHHHKYKYIRKLLLNRVNAGLGSFKDSPILIESAKKYILERKSGFNFNDFILKNEQKYQEIKDRLLKKNGDFKREPVAYRSFQSRNPQILNFTPPLYNLMIEVIKCCEICKNQEKQRRNLSIDHHGDIVRGVLCIECNRGLGNFNEDPEELKRAIDYLISEHQNFLKTKNINLSKKSIIENWSEDIIEIYEAWSGK